MNLKKVVSLLLILIGPFVFAQDFTINGQVKDASSGEDLIGVSIFVKELPGVGTISNDYGFYSLTLEKGTYTLIYSYIGFEGKEISMQLDKDIVRNVQLGTGDAILEEVIVSAKKENENVTSTEIGVSTLSTKEIDAIPVIFGEKDIIKTMTLLPGVKSAGEGAAGFYVRGGGVDHNLILLDEAPVYNASHLLGFFSVFNSDAIKDVKLYKGNIPAEYGGRLSSVMDIKMKDGNKKKFSASGGLGLISSRLTVEGPIQKDKSSFMISGRRTYADLFLKLSSREELKDTKLYFYDLNAKVNYTFNDRNRLFLSGYFGRDNFGFSDIFGFDWGNTTGTLRWNHIFNKKLFSNTSLIYSNYDYKFSISEIDLEIGSVVKDFNFKEDFDLFLNSKNRLRFGVNAIYHNIEPGKIETADDSGFASTDIPNRHAMENAAYIANEQKLGSRLTLDYGLRLTNFLQLGPGDVYEFFPDTLINGVVNISKIKDTTTYDNWEVAQTYWGLSPRLGASFVLNEQSSLKAAYTRTYQYIHLLSNTTSTTPTDIWLPSSTNIKPQISTQYSAGYFRNFGNNTYEFSVEGYYKQMKNVVDYKVGAVVSLNDEVEGSLLYGKGRAYGLELFFKKRKGDLTGWLSYTLAKSEKQIDGLNDGDWYNAKQDRLHDIAIVLMYDISDRLNVSGSWIYHTGNAVTYPSGYQYSVGTNQPIFIYENRNSYRLPSTHRLDLGITYKNKEFKMTKDPETGEQVKVKKKFQSNWNLSVYNAYGRQNPYSIDFRINASGEVPSIEAVQLALFKVVPAITYNFKF